jgi:hypothetical protein
VLVDKEFEVIRDPSDSVLKGIQATQVHREFKEWDSQAFRVFKET